MTANASHRRRVSEHPFLSAMCTANRFWAQTVQRPVLPNAHNVLSQMCGEWAQKAGAMAGGGEGVRRLCISVRSSALGGCNAGPGCWAEKKGRA